MEYLYLSASGANIFSSSYSDTSMSVSIINLKIKIEYLVPCSFCVCHRSPCSTRWSPEMYRYVYIRVYNIFLYDLCATILVVMHSNWYTNVYNRLAVGSVKNKTDTYHTLCVGRAENQQLLTCLGVLSPF